MVWCSAYLIRQVATDTNKEAYVKDVLDNIHEAKAQNDTSLIARNFYYDRSEQEIFRLEDTSIVGGEPQTTISYQLVKTNPAPTNGIRLNVSSYYSAFWYARYQRDVYAAYDISEEWLMQGGIWDASRDGSLNYYMSPAYMFKEMVIRPNGTEEVLMDWTAVDEYQGGARSQGSSNRTFPAYPAGVYNGIYYSGAAESFEKEYEAIIDGKLHNMKMIISPGYYSTNVPHFQTAAAINEYITRLDEYFAGTITQETFDSFMESNLTPPL